ncbi:peroxiredoxin family protein [Pedobacter sp. 22163]|uniref:peroxiredoxin family protein n=1 Tax=Pedobacter sp. 22163 TaxID=3453883 RepID=UPI003F83CB35
MKTITYCVLFLLITNLVSAQLKEEKNVVIFRGTADTIYNGSTLVLYNKAVAAHDSVQVNHGKFEITVPYKGPARYMFYSKFELKKKGGYSPYGILVSEPGIIQINANMEALSNSVVKNAPENERYMAFTKDGSAGRQGINDKLIAKFGPDVLKNLNQKNPQYDEIIRYYKELNDENNKLEVERLKTFIKLHNNSFASVYLLNNLVSNISIVNAQALYNLLGQKYKETSYGKNIASTIEAMKITAVGKIAPDFEQVDTAGKMIKLSSLRGQYVLLDFWASWCIACREENPNVVKAYNKFHDKGFTILGVSLDQPGKREAWLNAIKQDGLTWTNVSDLKFWNNEVVKLYGVQAVPQNFLLDKEGKIIAINVKGEGLNAKLTEIFEH